MEQIFNVEEYPYIAKPAMIYKKIEYYSNFYIVKNNKGKPKIIWEEKYER